MCPYMTSLDHNELTCWGQNQMANILQKTFFLISLVQIKLYHKGSIANKSALV